jgi:hypothetical protein
MFTDSNYRVMPKDMERTWILFPNNLSHQVYPFNSSNKDEERISFSFNATINFEENIN